MQVNKKGLNRIVAQEFQGQLEELGAKVIGRFGNQNDYVTSFEFATDAELEVAVIHASTYFSVKEYGMTSIPGMEDFGRNDSIIYVLEVWFNETTLDPLEEMVQNEMNGKENVIVGAFESADSTYPVFITRAVEISKDSKTGEGMQYRLSCLGAKWGYEPALNWPGHLDRGEAWLHRGTDRWLNQMGKQFKTLAELNNHRWKPAFRALEVPAEWHAKYTFVCFSDMDIPMMPESDDERLIRVLRDSVTITTLGTKRGIQPFNRK